MVIKKVPSNTQSGFSLVELAVMLVIYGGIAAMSVTLGREWIASQKIKTTQKKAETVIMALERYAQQNGRLPCPGNRTHLPDNAHYGLEAYEIGDTLGNCISGGSIVAEGASGGYALGSVPAKTLGLSESMMRDEWGGLLIYLTTQNAAREGSFWGSPPHANYMGPGSGDGDIEVQDGAGNVRTNNALIAIVSHGTNKHGAFRETGGRFTSPNPSAAELENCDCLANGNNGTLNNIIIDEFSNPDFDDLIVFKTRAQFLFKERK